jgi:uncharacterized protein (TIGR02271 family)
MGKFILIGAVIGSIIAWLFDFSVVTGLILGAIIGGLSYTLASKRDIEPFEATNKPTDQTLQLKEEQLDIKKERVQTDEVKIHKEVVEEQKTFTVPIRREEMVIEAGSEEELRIPLKEEEVEISKHPVQINEVSISKQQIKEIEQVKATLKKETAHVEIKGDADAAEESKQL